MSCIVSLPRSNLPKESFGGNVRGLWRWFRGRSEYDFWKLVDHLQREPFGDLSDLHIICDIDKTYLETQFESLIKMARIAMESAEDKLTVHGASEFLNALRWHNPDAPPRPLHFVSSSPPQLRLVLEDKLSLDGLDWTSDTFKNQAYNVIKGRVDQLSHHIAYKSAAILSIMAKAAAGSRFILIGDNAESDTYIYSGVAWYCAGAWTSDEYRQFLTNAGVEIGVADDLANAFATPPASSIERILIRQAPGYTSRQAGEFTSLIHFFSHYFEALLLMMNEGLIPKNDVDRWVRRFHNRYGFGYETLRQCLKVYSGEDANAPLSLEQALESYAHSRPRVVVPHKPHPETLLTQSQAWIKTLHEERKRKKEARR